VSTDIQDRKIARAAAVSPLVEAGMSIFRTQTTRRGSTISSRNAPPFRTELEMTVDAPVTLGFESDDCDRDFRAVVDRGLVALEPPANKEWGVRTAYFKGPGALKCEIEGPVTNR
jgi:uncharacterized glyoxalase superfamily protein PhnB